MHPKLELSGVFHSHGRITFDVSSRFEFIDENPTEEKIWSKKNLLKFMRPTTLILINHEQRTKCISIPFHSDYNS